MCQKIHFVEVIVL